MNRFMDITLGNRNHLLRTLITWFVIASFLLWILYRVLMQAKLGLPIECFFMAQVFVVLLIAPYLAARAVIHPDFLSTSFDSQCILSPISCGQRLLRLLLISQIPILCWVFLSTGVALFVTRIPFTKAFQMFVILGIYSVSAAAVGIWGAQVFRDALFSAEFATLLWCVLIGGAFLLNPLKRYVDDLQPFIPPVLHLNPLIVVCCIFEGLDIFRNPLLYELTPVPSYIFVYPKPWYLVGIWQIVIGGCCFLGAWQISSSRRYAV
ncbi:hypothetical protein C6500_17065 [Candidatus Poribacteria bacterium]|nr:MAG: hypothetical protein C6500_17065 [Candidatus Poribacteria bacterium]